MAPHGDYLIDVDTMDEVWRLLCALFRDGRQTGAGTGAWWRVPAAAAAVEERVDSPAPESLSVGDLASSFDDNG